MALHGGLLLCLQDRKLATLVLDLQKLTAVAQFRVALWNDTPRGQNEITGPDVHLRSLAIKTA